MSTMDSVFDELGKTIKRVMEASLKAFESMELLRDAVPKASMNPPSTGDNFASMADPYNVWSWYNGLTEKRVREIVREEMRR